LARNPRSTSNLTMMTMPPQYRRSVTFYVCPLLLVHARPFLGWVFPHVRADAQWRACTQLIRADAQLIRADAQCLWSAYAHWRARPPSEPRC
jgi:hypothetical protein